MGCWNETCMLSHLPIEDGEPVLLFFLEKKLTEQANWSPEGSFAPVWCIEGKYNGYGNLIETDPNNEQAILDTLSICKKHLNADTEIFSLLSLSDFIDSLNRDVCSTNRDIPVIRNQIWHSLRKVWIKKSFFQELQDSVFVDQEDACRLSQLQNAMLKGTRFSPREIRSLLRHDTTGYFFADLFMGTMAENHPNEFKMHFSDLWRVSLLLNELRMSWHIPSGSGSQKGVTSVMRQFSSIYNQEIEILKKEDDDL